MAGQPSKNNWEDKLRDWNLEERLVALLKGARALFARQSKTIRYAIYAAGAAVLALLLAGGWYWYDKSYEEKAWQLYGNIQYAIANKPNMQSQEAQEALKGFISQYPRSQAAAFVGYQLGDFYQMQNNLEGAISAYNAFIRRASAQDELTTIVFIALGHAYETSGEYAKAMESYQSAAKTKHGVDFASTNLQNIARIYEIKGDTKAALAHYEKALAVIQDPLSARLVKNKIASLLNG